MIQFSLLIFAYMFAREIIESFREWAAKGTRKPLVLRGARQVGKTTSVNIFAVDVVEFRCLRGGRPS
ncbi:MAG: hypothetical protein PF517_06395, partial [Salinivirgaceae bacterium]|nr:hypothetical protein [Salinivirgaceae bacterium]